MPTKAWIPQTDLSYQCLHPWQLSVHDQPAKDSQAIKHAGPLKQLNVFKNSMNPQFLVNNHRSLKANNHHLLLNAIFCCSINMAVTVLQRPIVKYIKLEIWVQFAKRLKGNACPKIVSISMVHTYIWRNFVKSPQRILIQSGQIIIGGDLNFTLGSSKIWGFSAHPDSIADFMLNHLKEIGLRGIQSPKLLPT